MDRFILGKVICIGVPAVDRVRLHEKSTSVAPAGDEKPGNISRISVIPSNLSFVMCLVSGIEIPSKEKYGTHFGIIKTDGSLNLSTPNTILPAYEEDGNLLIG